VVVVIDVHTRVLYSSFSQVVDKRQRGLAFLRLRMSPPGAVTPTTNLIPLNQTQKKEQAAVGAPERVSLEVEEHVTVVGLGHLVEAMAPGRVVTRRDEQVWRGSTLVLARLLLEPRLRHDPRLPLRSDAVDRAGATSKLGQGRHRCNLQRQPLGGAQTGDVDQRVLVSPLRLTDSGELAEGAVATRLR